MRLIFIKILFAFLFVSLLSCSFSEKTTRAYLKEAMKQPYDIIVVPGVPLENGTWSPVMKARIYWSKYLYDKGIAKNVMYSGSSVYTPYVEGEVMALYAEAIGIPKKNIFSETKAEHSTENIYYSYLKARKLGFKRIALASDPFQTKLLRRFTKKRVDKEVGLIPWVEDTLRQMESKMINPEIDPSPAFNKDFVSIMERENFWQRFKGTRGLSLDKEAYR